MTGLFSVTLHDLLYDTQHLSDEDCRFRVVYKSCGSTVRTLEIDITVFVKSLQDGPSFHHLFPFDAYNGYGLLTLIFSEP